MSISIYNNKYYASKKKLSKFDQKQIVEFTYYQLLYEFCFKLTYTN